ncbi:MAG TPA: HAD-IIIA family hydrolase [Bacteroidales bacterium]|nr:HAD-IIIA family hydrolase [Bacteroidales bacterium]
MFLDRDGVINRRIVGGYATRWEEFELLPGVREAVARFTGIFSRIIVVSNQQGVGKGLMKASDVETIHREMVLELEKHGGRIDAVFFSPHLASEHSILRKPGVGMALQARKRFPELRFRRSLMAGDSLSDMMFGKRAGMTTVLINPDPSLARDYPRLIDYCYPDLLSLANQL